MFGKIGRIQSHAQVTFSDAVCVEYGQTEDDAQTPSKRNLEDLEPSNDTTKRSMSGMSMEIHETIPEESENYSATEGEYSEDDSDHEESQVIPKSPQVGVRTPNRPPLRKKTQIMCPVIKFQLVNQLSNEAGGEILDANMSVMVRKEKESYPYEPIARFLRVNMEEPTHPYFNRVWHGRHILDADSPLLSVAARKRIRLNGGFWPEDLNNPESVRNHLRFSSVIIIMTGISNISAESVQISKRYYKDDVLIGYDFAPLLYQKEGSEMLRVDMNLINDVIEQSIGSAETLAGDDLSRPTLREHDMRDIITSSHSSKGNSSNSIRSFSSLRPSSATSESSN
ncbi:hypothetical protein CTEN210_04864 [Chaetoceros tenuissimus]|nr:hypothetical protein CTEN210_04864 [Chaetoceros tenuissimus]